MVKMSHIFFHLPILKWLHKNASILLSFFLKMHTAMTTVTIQSNKLFLNEVKDN